MLKYYAFIQLYSATPVYHIIYQQLPSRRTGPSTPHGKHSHSVWPYNDASPFEEEAILLGTTLCFQ